MARSLDRTTPGRPGSGTDRPKRADRPRPSRGRARYQKADTRFALLLMVPSLMLLAIVIAFPLYQSLENGFFDRSLLLPGADFVGLDNLANVITDEQFPTIVLNTFMFTIGATALSFVIAIVLAFVLNEGVIGQRFLRSAFILPWLLPGVVASFLWSWIFDSNFGVLNGILRNIGLIDTNIGWLNSGSLAMASLIIAKAWHSFPWMMIMLLAGLQSVPQDILDAASADGAGRLRSIRHIMLPHLRGVIFVVLLLETIWNLQQFEMIYVMTGGGPADSTTTFSVALYQAAFQNYDLGEAGALGIIWIAILSVFVGVYVKYGSGERS